MRARTKTAIAILTIFSIAAVGAVTFAAADVREIGRSDPKRAANYRLPLFNFSETYTDGVALDGLEVVVGDHRRDGDAHRSLSGSSSWRRTAAQTCLGGMPASSASCVVRPSRSRRTVTSAQVRE